MARILWRGLSVWDGAPIRLSLSAENRPSQNRKTGPMLQIGIYRDDVAPHTAQSEGLDVSVCGNCPLRPLVASPGEACYVQTFRGPRSAWQSGNDQDVRPLDLTGQHVRWGEYGDPGMVPMPILQPLLAQSHRKSTCYTHRWADVGSWLAPWSMASIDPGDVTGLYQAWDQGWRTFRPLRRGESTWDLEREVVCPYVTHGTQCIDCGLCSGNRVGAKSIVIPIH